MAELDRPTLEWAAQWITGSLKGETNERTLEFGSNMAMTIRAAALSTTTQREPIRECFSCAICELTVFRDCCDAGLCQSHYVAHMHEAHDGPSLSDLAEFWDTHQGENRVVVSYPAPSHQVPEKQNE